MGKDSAMSDDLDWPGILRTVVERLGADPTPGPESLVDAVGLLLPHTFDLPDALVDDEEWPDAFLAVLRPFIIEAYEIDSNQALNLETGEMEPCSPEPDEQLRLKVPEWRTQVAKNLRDVAKTALQILSRN
jgi:hypothetical protein